MPDFEELQAHMEGARSEREAAAREVARARERLGRTRRELERALRDAGPQGEVVRTLEEREAAEREALSAARIRRDSQRIDDRMEPFSDPREELRRLPDQHPILLFPVRLEVRFKQLGAPGDLRHQLWVRVFPDACSIEAFDETLTESEVARARDYWTQRWKAGQPGAPEIEGWVRDRDRGAWRGLMGTFNAGRAYWIREHYRPTNVDDIPVRTTEDETILVIPTDDPPGPAVRDALRGYWAAVWRAGGAAGPTAAALDGLADALGNTPEEAAALADRYPPHNLSNELQRADPDDDVQVAFLVFPPAGDVEARIQAWSSPARVTTLPERFVLLGFEEGNPIPVVQQLGRPIPDTLEVGASPGEDLDDVLQEVYGPEFADLDQDEKAERYVEYLAGQSETRWLFDFDAAVDAGMGFRVDISQAIHDAGLHRLFVLGVRLSADATAGQAALERLITAHHFGDTGFAILPQGTPTNNTEEGRSGWSVAEDPDEAYERYLGQGPDAEPEGPEDRRDGRWLAGMLGIDIDPPQLNRVRGYHGEDQRDARAMNTALWNATIGYFMESMLTPVFTDDQREAVRWLLIEHVSGRGRVPAIRIGDQPYGILPTTTFSDMRWLTGLQSARRDEGHLIAGLQQIYRVLGRVRSDWEGMVGDVAYVGKSGDAHQVLLQALGLHPNSVSWDLRWAQGFRHHFNRFQFLGLVGAAFADTEATYRERGLTLLRALGYVHEEVADPAIPILEKFFLGREIRVVRPLIDDRDLSERAPIRPYTDAGLNYIEWLVQNARTDHAAVREQRGFTDGDRPAALLYEMLRHSVNLAFANTGLNLYRNAELLTPAQASAARVDAEFIGIRTGAQALESKWDLIYRTDERITGPGRLVVDHISELVRTGVVNTQTRHLHEIIDALERLQGASTARLERAFVEHLDLCSYRLDAWLLGLVGVQLSAMRYGGLRSAGESRTGVYLGAYGWLENVRPRGGARRPADVPADLRPIFDPAGDRAIETDEANAGYIHAPSVNHALTAAVLRNAYISNATPDTAEPFRTNLSSERVRLALSIIEGIQQGQSLAALLGYHLERGLHDETDQELDVFIYELRKLFPLASNRMASTRVRPDREAATPEEADRNHEEEDDLSGERAVTNLEARNVVDGLALLDHIRETGNSAYPFGFPTGDGVGRLRPASGPEGAAIDAQIRRLMNIRDAVADLAMAEGVHQAVQANYDRAAGALDAYSKGAYPQLPDVVRSPGSGIGLTHRVGIHLPADAAPAASATPRARAAPAVDRWLEGLLPADLSTIACRVEHRRPAYAGGVPGPVTELTVSLADLGLRPLDLLHMLAGETGKNLTALDDHVLRHVHATASPRPDAEIEIRYAHVFDPAEGRVSFFELTSLIDAARTLVSSSRPLAPTDLALPNEADPADDATLTLPPGPIAAARQDVDALIAALEAEVVDPLGLLIDDEDFDVALGNAAAIGTGLDTWIDAFVERMRALSLYGFEEAGFGWALDRVQALHTSVHAKVADYRARWLEKLETYDELVTIQVPAAPTEEESVALLQEAERAISTSATVPVPDTVAAYLLELNPKKAAFDARLAELEAFLAGSPMTLADLVVDAFDLTPGLAAFDHQVLEFDEEGRQVLVLAEDLHRQAATTVEGLGQVTVAGQELLDEAASAADPKERVKLVTEAAEQLFGEGFRVVPRFTLGVGQAAELQQCLADGPQLLDHQTHTVGSDFPVDDWLYGVARVREKMGAWESLVMMAEGLRDGPALDLTPVQLPYTPGDHWLGLEYPPDHEIAGERLLYTAHAPGLDPTQPLCGLLLDEWTEVIPARQETTGLAFHYDQPNSEPPQALLLATPGASTGAWSWSDLVQTLHETLDLARLRAIEPDQVDRSPYAQFLPATVTAVTRTPVTIAMSYAQLSPAILRQP